MNCNYSRTFIPNMFWEKCSLSYKSYWSGFSFQTKFGPVNPRLLTSLTSPAASIKYRTDHLTLIGKLWKTQILNKTCIHKILMDELSINRSCAFSENLPKDFWKSSSRISGKELVQTWFFSDFSRVLDMCIDNLGFWVRFWFLVIMDFGKWIFHLSLLMYICFNSSDN